MNYQDLCEAEDIIRSQMRLDNTARENPHQSLQLAQIIDHQKDNDGRYTGYVTVEMLSSPGTRANVIVPVVAGQFWYAGGLPPVNTLCLVGWLPMNIGIVLSYYMYDLRKLEDTKELPELVPGELFFRAQAAGVGGGALHLRSDGSIVARAGDSVLEMKPDGSVIITAKSVSLAGGGDQLATKTFVTELFDSHTHGAGTYTTPGGKVVGASNVPIQKSDERSYTSKTKAS